MLLIVAHHYVVNSGLIEMIRESPVTPSSWAMIVFGAWGKTGINCFVLITGYFMCRSTFTWEKLLKLYLQIILYAVVIFGIFCVTGHESFSIFKSAFKLFPVKGVDKGFTSCFIVFFLFIPFINRLISVMNRREHTYLTLLLLAVYTILPSLHFNVSFNYVTWFFAIYMTASFIRIYGFKWQISHKTWGWLSLSFLVTSTISVLTLFGLYKYEYIGVWAPYYLISDSNKILALMLSVASFMWFKDLKIPHSRFINAIGATTFGVLLIHANSDAMRQWLWRETVDCMGHFSESVLWTLGYSVASVLVIFVVCSGIDWFRGRYIEPPLINLVKETGLKIHKKVHRLSWKSV